MPFLYRLKVQALRRCLKAFRAYKTDNRPRMTLHDLWMDLAHLPLEIPTSGLRGLIPSAFEDQARDLSRQILLRDQRASETAPAMLRFAADDPGPFFVAAPGPWRRFLAERGMRIRSAGSVLLWWWRLCSYFTAGLRLLLRIALTQVGHRSPTGPYAVFVEIRRMNLPKDPNATAYSEDIYSWYRKSALYHPGLKEIWAVGPIDPATVDLPGVKVVTDPLPSLESAAMRRTFLFDAFRITAVALLRFLAGQWWAPVLLRDALWLAYARRLSPQQYARDYFFNTTNATVRPLWTYLLENGGSRFTSIEYSQNVYYGYLPGQPEFKLRDPTVSVYTWSRYAVLDHNHATSLRDVIHTDREIEFIESPVGWRDNGIALPEIRRPAILLVDSSPIRDSTLAAAGQPPRYHTDPDVVLQFLEESMDAAKKMELSIVYKPKVSIDMQSVSPDQKDTYPKADAFRELLHKYNCVLVNSDTSAIRIAKACDLVLAIPFSSAGVVAGVVGRPVAFFDVLGTLEGFQSRSHGYPLLHSKAEVTEWFRSVLGHDAHHECAN